MGLWRGGITNQTQNWNTVLQNNIPNELGWFIYMKNFRLHEKYKEGGLNLQDICLKKQALRVKWLIHLTQCDDSCIEKHLSNTLIGRHKKIVGLKILHASHKFDKDIQCEFYREAIKAWRIIFHSYVPKNMLDIKRDWIYENVLLKDDDGRIFKPPSHFPAYAPEYFYDLPVEDNPREFKGIYRILFQS